jgi:xylose isomerase
VLGRAILDGSASLEDLHAKIDAGAIDPKPVSGGQERLEGLVNRRIWDADR